MSNVSAKLRSIVRKWGWMAIGNVYFDNAACVNPVGFRGMMCCDEHFFFFPGNLGLDNGNAVDHLYSSGLPGVTGHRNTIVCVDEIFLQHFDVMLFNTGSQVHNDKFQVPNFPKPSDITSLEKNPETGLYDGYPVAELVGYGRRESVCTLYPEYEDQNETVSLRINAYREFQHNHDLFVAAVNEIFEVSAI